MSVSIRVTATNTLQLFALLNRLAVAGLPDEILERFDTMSGSINEIIDRLKVNMDRLESMEDRVQAFAESVPAMIQAAIDAAKAEGATDAQLAELVSLNSRLENEISDLAASAGASDAAEPVEPEPAPVEPNPAPEPVPAPADGTVPVEPVPDQPGNTVPPAPLPNA